MRIRAKLLTFLLILVLPPLVLVSAYAVWESQNLGQKLADGAETSLIQTVKQDLLLSLTVMRSEIGGRRHELERTVALVAKETEALLIGPPGDAKDIVFDSESERQDVLPSSLVRAGEEAAPFVFHEPSNGDRKAFMEQARRLQGLEPAFTTFFPKKMKLRPQGWVLMDSGLSCYASNQEALPTLLPHLDIAWEKTAAGLVPGQIHRLLGQTDGFISITLRKGIYLPDGRLIGVAGIVAPIAGRRPDKELPFPFSTQMRSLLLAVRERPAGGEGLFLVGEGASLGQDIAWKASIGEQWLESAQPGANSRIIQDILNGRSGVREIRFAGKPVFLAYQPLVDGLVLAVEVPRDSILAHADQAEDAIMGQTWNILSVTAAIALATIGLVLSLAFTGSRAVTRPVAELAEAANRLAAGDLVVRVPVAGRDELSDLSHAFNTMVPQLAERLVLKQDMELAREVQQTLVPREAPLLPGLDIAAASVFCDATGGDYYDFLDCISQAGRGCDIVIGDATGHGIAAALLMTTSRALLRGCAATQVSPGELLSTANNLLCRDTDLTGRFVTIFYLRLEAGGLAPRGRLLWARAGHDPGLVFDPKTQAFQELQGKGLALGAVPDYAYATSSSNGLTPGQILVMATDGAWEARNGRGEMFGKTRFMDVVRRYATGTAKDIVGALHEAVREFQGGKPAEDDVTVVVVKATEGLAPEGVA